MATTAPAPAPNAGFAGSKELKRDIGLIGLAWASLGSIIGSGWLFGARNALIITGPSAILSWVIGAVAITILALVHAELGAMWPVSGGTARFPHIVYGGFGGAFFGWFSWLQAATVAPIEVNAMIDYAAAHYSWAAQFLKSDGATLTGKGIGVAIGLMAVMTVVNLVSVRFLATINSALTWWKLAVPVVTIIILLSTHFHSSNFTAGDGFAPAGLKGIFQAVATGGIIFALLGFEQADQLAGEARNPKRDIPLGIILSMVLGGIVYVLLEVAFTGALPPHLIPKHWVGAVDLNKLGGPFAQVAGFVGLGWLAKILYADAVISPAGTGLIYTTATSRVSYGLSRNGYYPKPFEAVTQKRVPWFGLIVTFVLGCVIFLPFPSWNSLVGIITSVSVLMYAGAPLALGALRVRTPDAARPYRLPGATVTAPLAFVVADLLVLFSGWTVDWKIGVATIVGFALIAMQLLADENAPNRPRMPFRAAAWIPVWLIGMEVLTYLSSFNDARKTYFIPFGWDILVVAVWSLIIYFWAMNSALPKADIDAMVEETVVPEDSELAGAELVG